MPNLYTISTAKDFSSGQLTPGEIKSVIYHDFFDYPLNFSELIKWKASPDLEVNVGSKNIISRNGFYFLEGKEGLIFKRLLRNRISSKKILIAKKAAKILALFPTIKMAALTGSLAMGNSADDGDIDLLIVTKNNLLWTTRMLVLAVFALLRFPVRRSWDKNQKDKLCLNIWMDEADLCWRYDRNIYTAHEIAQTTPLFNKNKTFEKFITQNMWVKKYWPGAVGNIKKINKVNFSKKVSLAEKISYKLQYLHMKNKITRETISPTRALFHPQDWSRIVLRKFAIDT